MNEYLTQLINEGTDLVKSVKEKKDQMGFSIYYCDDLDKEMAIKSWELKVAEIVELYGLKCHKQELEMGYKEVHSGITPIRSLREKNEIIKRIADLDKILSLKIKTE
jgi:hypothetical protein